MELRRSLLVGMLLLMAVGSGDAALSPNFYHSSCPNVQRIVRRAVMKKLRQTFVTVPSTTRLFFHDCFIRRGSVYTSPVDALLHLESGLDTGCDAGIMISSPNNDAEKDAPENNSLAGDGFDTIIKAKEAVEAHCPGVVSCADIMAIAARDAVNLAGGPFWTVELGRRDGLISRASDVAESLPPPSFNVDTLTWLFAKNNLSQFDMVALSGAHTFGVCNCGNFADRLYSFSKSSPVDPLLKSWYAKQLMGACPRDVNPLVAVQLDPITPRRFDSMYYTNLMNGLGLLFSDQVLFTDARTRPLVVDWAMNQRHFFEAFTTAMVKLGRTGVLTGDQGEIRRDCTAFNA